MPVFLEDLGKSNIQEYDAKFFSDFLTGKGKTTGVLNETANPRYIKDASTSTENIHCTKRQYSNGETTISSAPFYIISSGMWANMYTVKLDDMSECCEIVKTKSENIYFRMVPHSAVYERTVQPNDVVKTNLKICYQIFLYNVNCKSTLEFEQVGEIHDLLTVKANTFYTDYTCNPKDYFENEIDSNIGPYATINYDNFATYLANYELYDEVIKLSQEWQTRIPEIIEDAVKQNIKRVSADGAFTLVSALMRKLEKYKIPLEFYKTIYDIIRDNFPNDLAEQLYKQNLNLLLSRTLRNLNQNKAQLTYVPASATPIQYSKKFSTEQLKAIATTEPLVLVQAGAGTGKSTVVLGRIEHMVKSGIQPEDITVISFTNAAADHITKLNPKVHSMTIARMIHEIYSENFKNHELSNLDTIINAIDIYFPIHTDFMYEFQKRLRGLKSRNEFTLMNNFVEENFDEVINTLNTIRQTSLELEIIICYHMIETFTEPKSVQSKFLIIDEVQDNSIFEFIYALKYVDKHSESLFMVGDCSQTLYEFRASNPEALNILEGSGVFATYPLQTNYRSNQEILDFANVVLRNIESNQYANIQLQANSLQPVTEQSFREKVQLHYECIAKMTDLRDALPSIINVHVRDYINDKLAKGEQVAFLAYRRDTINQIEQILKNLYPNKKIVNLIPIRGYNTTIFSSYIKQYWSEVQLIPTKSLMTTISQDIMKRLDYLTSNPKKALPGAQALISQWYTQESYVISGWQHQYMNGQMSKTEFLQHVKENMLNFEIRQNAIKQQLISNRNTENKQNRDLDTANFILSTIHSAKGLEFENTVVLHTNKNQMPDDEKRLYYVAFTRAMKSEFVLSYGSVKKPRIESDYNNIVSEIKKRNASSRSRIATPTQPVTPISIT